MYESHFGFSGSPFQLNPDPAFYFGSRGHSNALAYLKFGAHQGEGFIVVTGEIGAGKTTLVRTLLEGLNPDQVVAAHVVNTQLESSELLQSILLAFGVASNRTSKPYLIATLEGFLTTLASKGRRALLIIDEAQNLRHEAVEELRMLSNFQLGKYGLLQSFLVGQPELRNLLQSKSMEQLRQRVIASCHLGPLDAVETRSYIEHRLRVVGWREVSPQIAADVFDRIHHWTGGVPRKINRLCNRLLLGAFLANARVVTAAMVDETAAELKSEIGEGGGGIATPQLPVTRPAASTALAPPVPTPVPTLSPAPAPTPAPTLAPAPAPTLAASAPPSARAHATSIALPPIASAPRGQDAQFPESLATVAAAQPQAVWVEPDVRERHTAPPQPLASAKPQPQPQPQPADSSSPNQRLVRRVHDPVKPSRPLIFLIDSASDYLKAGVLAEVFRGFPSLPGIVAVHTGPESELSLDDLEEMHMPMPAMGVHLGVPAAHFASQTPGLVDAFDALLTEMDPRAIMLSGSSEAALACSLLTRKRGFPLLRIGSGRRDTHHASNHTLNTVLIERLADVLYTDSTESFYALYREGIRLDRVCSVGSLTREMLDIARAQEARQGAPSTVLSIDGAPRALGSYGLITVDPLGGFSESGTLSKAIELFSDFSKELPLVWMMSAKGRRLIEYSNDLKRIEASNLTLVDLAGVRRSLALLRGAKCLIARDAGDWLAEAKALALPALILTPNSSLESAYSAPGPAVAQVPSDSGRAIPRLLLEASISVAQPPEYWDGGTASRVAAHLVTWFAKAQAGSPHTAPALVES